MTRPFHRPARLEDAESIEGSQDTAVSYELAHSAAQALVGGFPETGLTREGVRAVAARGVDEVAELWADCPATTLPGTLWRLFLVREWLRRDPGLVSRRYATVVDLSADAEAAARFEAAEARPVPSPEQVRAALDTVLAGGATGSVTALAPLLSVTASFLRALAAGSTPTWIEDDADALADHVTRRVSALTATADELAEASRRAAAGLLD